MSKTNKNKKSKEKGFSILESVLSVFLVALGLVAALSLLTAGLSQSLKNRDQFIASLLTQEGVEIVRNIRDNNWIDEGPETSSFSGFPGHLKNITEMDDCIVDPIERMIHEPSINKNLYFYDEYYRIKISSATPESDKTKFGRKLIFKYFCCSESVCEPCSIPEGANLAVVTSMVIWNKEGKFPEMGDCNTETECAYTQINLNSWGE